MSPRNVHAKPRKDPPAVTMSQGAVLSPRRARFWTWITDRGIPLNSFSTDTCVVGQMAKLESAHLDALGYLLSDDPELPAYPDLENLLGDLETLMRRIPANRVKATRGGWGGE